VRITLLASPDELLWVDLLNAMARHNARQFVSDPTLPPLYDSGVRYHRNEQAMWCRLQELRGGGGCADPIGELWCDVLTTYELGYEDCDGLSAIRAGELLARGTAALRPGERGYRPNRRRRVHAEVALRTRQPLGRRGGLYHCIVRYRVLLPGGWSRWLYDDPSARLGMRSNAPDAQLSA